MISVDKLTYGVILSSLHHAFVYPIKDIKIKVGFDTNDFKKVFESYNVHDSEIKRSDLDVIISSVNLMSKELNDNDFNNLIQVNKDQAFKLNSLLEAARKDEKIGLITSDLWN